MNSVKAEKTKMQGTNRKRRVKGGAGRSAPKGKGKVLMYSTSGKQHNMMPVRKSSASMQNVRQLEESIMLYGRDEALEDLEKRCSVEKLKQLVLYGGTPAEVVRFFREHGGSLLDYITLLGKLNKRLIRELERADGVYDQNGKRWTPDEDNALVEMACDDSYNLAKISRTLGRTPLAVSSRLSKLVGVERLSSQVVGRFNGEIDGVYTEAEINGTLTKGAAR